MRPRVLLLCAVSCNVVLTIVAGCATRGSEAVESAASAPLVGTSWQLSQLDGRTMDRAPGSRSPGLRLDPQNTRVTGFAGCNQLFGGYALDGENLKFAQLGGTRMACTAGDAMSLEQRYVEILSRVTRWRIRGNTLELFDGRDAPAAVFTAPPGASAAP
jgi:heat shock protein HslJ